MTKTDLRLIKNKEYIKAVVWAMMHEKDRTKQQENHIEHLKKVRPSLYIKCKEMAYNINKKVKIRVAQTMADTWKNTY